MTCPFADCPGGQSFSLWLQAPRRHIGTLQSRYEVNGTPAGSRKLYSQRRILLHLRSRAKIDRVSRRLSKRAVLRTGYGAVIAVLVFAVLQAYRIQSSVSEQSVEIYRRYVDQDTRWPPCDGISGSPAHTFGTSLSRRPRGRPPSCEAQLKSLDRENEAALRASREDLVEASVSVANIRKSMEEFWDVIEPLPRTMLHEPNARQYEFLQREIVPRRGDLYSTLLSVQAADQQRLEDSEKEFAAARRDAATRLLLILASACCSP